MSVTDQIVDRLKNDAPLMEILTGGVYGRPIVASGPGATEEAFVGGNARKIKPSATVEEADDSADWLGPRGSFVGLRRVKFYAQTHDTGRTAINAAMARSITLLYGFDVVEASGSGGELEVSGRRGPADSDQIDGALDAYIEVRVTGLMGVF